MMTAYVSRSDKRFIAQLILPGISDIEEILTVGDELFDKIPFSELREGWWREDGVFLGERLDNLIGPDGQPI